MKDTVGWIDYIPDGWNIMKFRQLITRISTGLNPRDNFKLTKDDNLYYVTIRNFKDGKLYLDDKCDRISYESWKIIQERSDLHKGDILFASISKDGHAYLLKEEPASWNVNESVFCIRVNKEYMDARYFTYEITSTRYYDDLRMDATGTTFKSIKQNNLKQSRLLVPPISEQQAIADYLDEKCLKIDEIIVEAKVSIEEYKDLKQSVIFEVVTKGLDKTAEVKDSGYDFLGYIPDGWEMCKVRHLGTAQNGISIGGDAFGSGYPFVSYGDVYKNYSLPKSVDKLVQSSEEDRKRYSVEKGDWFFTRTSETIDEVGFSCVCEETIPDAVFAGFLIRVRPFNNRIYTRFAKYYFRSKHLRAFFVKEMNLVTRASLSQGLLKDTPVVVPPYDEQIEIANYLEDRCATIDGIIKDKESLIKDLEAYKKSLIYEVVTGKRRVV